MIPRSSKLQSRSGVWPLAAAIAGIAIAVSLGNWQLGRAAGKLELQERFDALAAQPPIFVGTAELEAADVDLRRVEARGIFEPQHTIFVDNRTRRGVPGFHVVTPLRIEGGERHVLVNRGWVPWNPQRSRLPEVRTPDGAVTVTGIALIPARRTLELSDKVIEGRIWQNVTVERYREAFPSLSIQPFMIRQHNVVEDGLVREWESPDFGVDKHYGYAFQWYALAVTILVFYAVTRFRRNRVARD